MQSELLANRGCNLLELLGGELKVGVGEAHVLFALHGYKVNVCMWDFEANYSTDFGQFHANVAARAGGVDMQRKGNMRNGMAPEFSYGKSGTAHFGEMGTKGSLTFDAGRGHVFAAGLGYEWRAPLATTAFAAPEISNDFVSC